MAVASRRSRAAFPADFLIITAIHLLLLLVIFHQVWEIRPSADDYYPPLAEVHRGMAEGPWSFFTESSSVPFYRPLTFMSVWLAGVMSMDRIVTWVHAIHFFWVAACICILALWARTLDYSRFACAVTGLVFVAHPVLAGPLGSIDGFQRVAATAWVWLGAWFVLRSRTGSTGGDLAAAACLALALGFAEYGLGLVPLAALAALWRRKDGRSWGSIARLLLILGAVTVAWHVVRTGVIAEGLSEPASVRIEPLAWLENAALLLAVALFWGNTVFAMLGPAPWATLTTALAVVLALVWFAAGLRHAEVAAGRGGPGWLARSDTGLLLPALPLLTFPMLILGHVSELYATPVLMAVALLAGRAAEGWRRMPGRRLRPAGLALAGIAVLGGLWASLEKLGGLADAGRRTDAQTRQILDHVPADARGWRIATIFDGAAMGPAYSVFATWDVVRGATLRWFAPEQGLDLVRLTLPEDCDRLAGDFDLRLRWDPASGRYRPVTDDGDALCRR